MCDSFWERILIINIMQYCGIHAIFTEIKISAICIQRLTCHNARNSSYLTHYATFFIVWGAKTSVGKPRLFFLISHFFFFIIFVYGFLKIIIIKKKKLVIKLF